MMLPEAPSDAEKYLYVDQAKGALYTFAIISTVLVATGGVFFALTKPAFIWYLAFVVVNACYLAASYFLGLFSKSFDLAAHNAHKAMHGARKPSFDVFLPCAGEDVAVLRNTYRYVRALKWGGELNVHVLDDSHRDEVRAAALEHGFNYVARANRGELKKAGNIRHAFAQTSGELILILDADFCPRADMLDEVAHYFENEKVGIVQTPQYFRVDKTHTAIQRGSASVQELFYRLIQVNRNHWGASICVGTCATYRRAALEPFGGTYPIEHSEDVHTGFNLLKNGWEVKYVPINLAAGLCPDQFASFLTQQYRWCMGSTTLMLNRELFWGTKIPLMARLCFLSGMVYYSVTALSVFMVPLPSMLVVWFSPEHVKWWNIAFSLPSFLLGTVFMAWWNRSPYGLSAVAARHASYWAHTFALKDRLFGSVMPWVPTGDAKQAKGTKRVRQIRASIVAWTCGTTTVGWAGAARAMQGQPDIDFLPYFLVSAFYAWLHLSCLWSDKPSKHKTCKVAAAEPLPVISKAG